MLNQINIMGRLVKDPELRRANETPVCTIRIACDRDYKNANGEKEADFFDVVAWRKLAEIVSQYAAKGRMVSVTGRLQMRSWQDNEGRKHYAPEIVAEHIYFCDPKPKDQNNQGSYGGNYGQPPVNSNRNAVNVGYGQTPANGSHGYGNAVSVNANAYGNGSADAYAAPPSGFVPEFDEDDGELPF